MQRQSLRVSLVAGRSGRVDPRADTATGRSNDEVLAVKNGRPSPSGLRSGVRLTFKAVCNSRPTFVHLHARRSLHFQSLKCIAQNAK